MATFSEEKNDAKAKKACTKITVNLHAMKFLLYGDGDADPKQADIDKLCHEIFQNDLLLKLVDNFAKFEFEARKDVSQIYNFVLRHKQKEAAQYVLDHKEILTTLVNGYGNADIALNCGSILREVIRHEKLNEMILYDDTLFSKFFEYVQLTTFDVASDAFGTFKLLLTKSPKMCGKFLNDKFDGVFTQFDKLLQSSNYVTKRQSLKLLGELLMNRSNYQMMMKYINSEVNLKTMMNLLKGTTKAIQFEAFHVFKIFVANPKKSQKVLDILIRNKDKLMTFLEKFQKDKEDDVFEQEKQMLVAALKTLDKTMLESADNKNGL
eukprot:CAMPEP_0175091930 /NCGR_PEP_ID=MMETSP0086_2-20121207/2181_1 /TAXON_ID=136419 /ORGANISM="Unknown Unknown, Strain D1" /LENGTH=321 /DNA_ID=CAMNT_0016364737 /DNA_START=162 /DNA_END=1127 /DNA_ORIENTATION=+